MRNVAIINLPRFLIIQTLLQKYRTVSRKLLKYGIPNGCMNLLEYDPFSLSKKFMRTQEVHASFAEHRMQFSSEHVYTDGSKMTSSWDLPPSQVGHIICDSCMPEISIFTAKLYIMKKAVTSIFSKSIENSRYTIFSESQSVIMIFESLAPTSPISQKIRVAYFCRKHKQKTFL